jgi:hypothetical protein
MWLQWINSETVIVRHTQDKNDKCFDADCRASRSRSRMFERRYQRSHSDTDRLAWMLPVKAMRQLYEEKSHQYWQALIAHYRESPKKLWHTFYSHYTYIKTFSGGQMFFIIGWWVRDVLQAESWNCPSCYSHRLVSADGQHCVKFCRPLVPCSARRSC